MLVGAEAALRELQRALLCGRRANLQKLDDAALVRREANDFTNHLADQSVALALATLILGWLPGDLFPRNDEALVETSCEARTCRLCWLGDLSHDGWWTS